MLARRTFDVERAIQATSSDYPELEGTEISLQKLAASSSFVCFLERVHDGHRDTDDKIVATFIDEGDFYLPTDEQRTSVAKAIISSFIKHLASEFYKSDEGLAVHSNRQEVLVHEKSREVISEVRTASENLHTELSTINARLSALSETVHSDATTDSPHAELERTIDFARDLINRGLVYSARRELERIDSDARTIPKSLRYRIATNLGACALVEDDIDLACDLFEDAHHLQPTKLKGIANASLAAHLRKDSIRAIRLARRVRVDDPRNSQATAVLIRELWEAGLQTEIDDLVGDEEWVVKDKECGLTLVMIWTQQSRFEEAERICTSLAADYVDDADVLLALSRCLGASSNTDHTRGGGMSAQAAARLPEAESAASRAIEILRLSELRAQRHQALLTRALIRRRLGAYKQAMKDLDEVLSEASNQADALFNKALLLLFEGRLQDARSTFESIEDSERRQDALLPLAQACLGAGDPGEAIRILKGNFSLENPDWEGIRGAEILMRAEALGGHTDSVSPTLDTALLKKPTDPHLLALLAWRCELTGDFEGAERSLLCAHDHANESDRLEVQLELGDLYQKQGRFSEAASLFAEVVDNTPLHPAAIPLLQCLVNSQQLREALHWAQAIRTSHQEPPRFAIDVEAWILEHIGDVRAAIDRHKELCASLDSTAVDLVRLATAQFRSGDDNTARKTIYEIHPHDLTHDPTTLLRLVHLKFFLGISTYLEDAYLARRFGIDDPEIHRWYVHFFLHRRDQWVEPETVSTGCAVLLTNEEHRQWWNILDKGEEGRSRFDVSEDHDLAKELLGKPIGHTVVLRDDIEELSYKIAEIQSKFVRALQETFEEFSTRFPGNTGMSRISMEDGDFTKLLYTVDTRHQFVRDADRLYMTGQLPFASFSSLLGLSTIEVWHACTETDQTKLRFSAGTAEEAAEASDLLKKPDLIVLELTALLTVQKLRLKPYIQSRFPRVVVPQHVIDEIQEVYSKAILGPPTGHLGKGSDGRYLLTEASPDDWDDWKNHVHTILEFAESFDRIASYGLLDADNTDQLSETLTHAGMGAIYSSSGASRDKLVLVSDDLGLSSCARYLGIDTVNTQAVLRELRRLSIIGEDQYANWIERLIKMNYSYVRIQARDIFLRLKKNEFATTIGTRAMIDSLEGPHCSEDSAVFVGAKLIALLSKDAPLRQTDLILWRLLSVLRRGRELSPVLYKFRETVSDDLSIDLQRRDRLTATIDSYIRLNAWPVRSVTTDINRIAGG